jgi:energy-coupling factor transporter ATP-binding protein EcfA2
VAGVLARPARLGRTRLVAVDGPSGAGKTTVTATLAGLLAAEGVTVAVVPTDHFATWTDPVSWWPRLVDGVLTPMRNGLPGRYRRTEWSDGTPRPGDDVVVPVVDVLVVEGVSAGRRSVRDQLTFLVWVELPDQARRLDRTVARDGANSRPALAAWQRFECGWFTVDRTVAAADTMVSARW